MIVLCGNRPCCPRVGHP